MGARCLLLALASGLAPEAGAAEAWAAARSEAEVDTQQECEYAAARVEALQTKSALTAEAAAVDPEFRRDDAAAAAAASLPDDACHQCANATGAEELEAEELAEEPLYADMDGNPWIPGPNIYLASLVDQRNYRSYCLDISGSPPHPQCTSVQGHTCKVEGEDTQFEYVAASRHIRSQNFNADCDALYSGSKNGREWEASTDGSPACLTVTGDITAGATLALSPCSATSTNQEFMHTDKGQFQVGETGFCLVLAEEATTFADETLYIRSLEIQDCEAWPETLSQWEVLSADHSRLGWTATSDSSQTE